MNQLPKCFVEDVVRIKKEYTDPNGPTVKAITERLNQEGYTTGTGLQVFTNHISELMTLLGVPHRRPYTVSTKRAKAVKSNKTSQVTPESVARAMLKIVASSNR